MGNFEEISVIMGCTFRAHSTLVCMPRSRTDRRRQVRCPAVQVNTVCSRIFAHQVYMYTKTPRYYHVKRDGQVPNRNSSPFPQAITHRLHQCALSVAAESCSKECAHSPLLRVQHPKYHSQDHQPFDSCYTQMVKQQPHPPSPAA